MTRKEKEQPEKKKYTLAAKPEAIKSPVFLSYDDFCQIDFQMKPNDRFAIVTDALEYLTGQSLKEQPIAKSGTNMDSQSEDEFRKVPSFPTPSSNDELQAIKDGHMLGAQYDALERAFKKLYGYPDRFVPGTDCDKEPFLVE